ncbi:hypothetical protein L1987_63321 [Smallanthus sonchifolius]|uniref:Uncharacterized protein n=1 Tax=Smallanthus sonchifolius TaxID=185202 RepID=A0ACB9CD62_9ASTR|nr:hypothetical protein L1987_63321 [Smallanthus sonchifolius]
MSSQSDYNSPPHSPLKSVSAVASAVSPPTPPTRPSSDGNSTTSHQSETAATASLDDNDATPPLQLKPPPPPPKNTSVPVREDCWSEDATFTLIEAWGDRILKLNSGSLRQKHWLEVADAVNGRHGHVKKARRTDVQCKNRIDTLKKKYKVEKALVLELGSDHYVSPWPFFAPLDSLIGSSFKPSTKTPTPPPQRKRIPPPPAPPSRRALPPPPSSVPVGRRSKRPPPPAYQPSTDSSFFRRNFSVMAAAAAAIDGAEDDSDTSLSSGGNRKRSRSRSRNGKAPVEKDRETRCDPFHQLAEAIGRFAEVYKRVEEGKQRQMVELEKQRMQFTKDLEIERMKLLMESQVQLRKLKRVKSNSGAGLCRSDDSASIS